jgi:hypothetical protein
MTAEIERVRRHGFLASEFGRQKAETLRDLEREVKEKDNRTAPGRLAPFICSSPSSGACWRPPWPGEWGACWSALDFRRRRGGLLRHLVP